MVQYIWPEACIEREVQVWQTVEQSISYSEAETGGIEDGGQEIDCCTGGVDGIYVLLSNRPNKSDQNARVGGSVKSEGDRKAVEW